MKHESIIVVYDSCQALAEEIADLLGAESISVQSMNNRYVENGQSFVLAVEYQTDGHLTPHWQYAFQTFCRTDLSGKKFALFVALGNIQDQNARWQVDDVCAQPQERRRPLHPYPPSVRNRPQRRQTCGGQNGAVSDTDTDHFYSIRYNRVYYSSVSSAMASSRACRVQHQRGC